MGFYRLLTTLKAHKNEDNLRDKTLSIPKFHLIPNTQKQKSSSPDQRMVSY